MVAAGETVGEAATGSATNRDRLLGVWLLVCCATIFAMVVLGGVTRLTGSGLSMVEWQPILGVLPPMSEAEWQDAFEKYRQYPEYRLKNLGMDLAGFKGIFWLEYFHRLLGRLIGVFFALPFAYFLIRGYVDRPLGIRLTGLFLLGGAQGLLGWFMVQSGMVDDPHVSPYRLTAHLLLAILIYAWMLSLAIWLLEGRDRPRVVSGWVRSTRALMVGALLVIASGGFVAGTKAGFAFNTFPLMNGQWIPEGLYIMEPWWRNLFENIITVQFNHRWLALSLAAALIVFWWLARRAAGSAQARLAVDGVLAATVLQVALGISTLLLAVPIPLAAAHQGGAVLVLSALLFASARLKHAGAVETAVR